MNISASGVSHHLARLRAIRLVRTRRNGNQIFYSIDDAHVAALFQEALYHLDHVRKNLPDHPYSYHKVSQDTSIITEQTNEEAA